MLSAQEASSAEFPAWTDDVSPEHKSLSPSTSTQLPGSTPKALFLSTDTRSLLPLRRRPLVSTMKFTFSLLLSLSALVSASPLNPRQLVTPPTDDPFYTPPAGYESSPHGTILATRSPPSLIAALGVLPVPLKSAHQILYRSTDSFGNPSSTVTTVLVPLTNSSPSRLLSYQVAQDSAYLNCAPSYAFQALSSSDGLLGTAGTQIEILAIGAALAEGWIVTIPDHEGPNAAFLANTRGGQHVLDGIRATLASGLVDPNAKIAMWGYSGGSLVSSFAAELAPTYAPELLASNALIGVALGGAVPNITTALPYLTASPFAGLVPGGIIGLANEYASIAAKVSANLLPNKAEYFNKARTQCLGANLLSFLGQDVLADYFTSEELFFSDPEVLSVTNANAMGQRPIPASVPVFMYKGVQDQISPVEDTDALYNFYCTGGARVEYIRDVSAEHATLLITGVPSAVQWIKWRFEGDVVPAGCVKRNVLTSLGNAAAQKIKKEIRDRLAGFLGRSEVEKLAH
jgi:hypothetical protein